MKIVFLFDQLDAEGKIVATDVNPYVITPEKLQLQQLAAGQTGLGFTLERTNEKGEKVPAFYSVITFPVNISLPAPAPAPVEAAPVAEAKPVAKKKAKKSGK